MFTAVVEWKQITNYKPSAASAGKRTPRCEFDTLWQLIGAQEVFNFRSDRKSSVGSREGGVFFTSLWKHFAASPTRTAQTLWCQVKAIMRRIVWIVENIFGGLRFRDLEKGDPAKCRRNLKVSALLNYPLDWRQVKAIMRRIVWIVENIFGGLRFRDLRSRGLWSPFPRHPSRLRPFVQCRCENQQRVPATRNWEHRREQTTASLWLYQTENTICDTLIMMLFLRQITGGEIANCDPCYTNSPPYDSISAALDRILGYGQPKWHPAFRKTRTGLPVRLFTPLRWSD